MDTPLVQALRRLPVTPAGARTRWMWGRLLAVASGAEAPDAAELREQYAPEFLIEMPPEQLLDAFVRFAFVAARTRSARIASMRPNVLTAVFVTSERKSFRYRCVVEQVAPYRILGHLSSPAIFSPALESTAYTDRVVRRSGRSVQVRDFGGDGPLLLLWHGGGCDLTLWEAMVAQLGSFRVVAQDLPGHGRSALSRYSLADTVADADAVLADLGLGEPTLVGHSIGGRSALHYAATRPCRGLVCLDGPNTLADADVSEISALDCPTMIVLCSEPEGLGAETWTARRRELCDYVGTHHPVVRVEWLPTGHLPMLTMPEQTAALIGQLTITGRRPGHCADRTRP
ncbi:MAG TPA: alpha/beta fold hydrolase [Mycobacteriales bacterium]|nr:alpha/beta fold hydrolase [Mycobacteriales bacterium]